MKNFKELIVWQLSKELAVEIYKLTKQGLFAKDYVLTDQIRRSAISIPSNIAEGDHLGTDKQSVKHFYIARGSTAELRTQLIIAQEVGYISPDDQLRLEQICDDLSGKITKLISHRSQSSS